MRLLAACKAIASRSLYIAVLVSLHTGLRNRELRLLRWRRIDLVGRELTVGKSKTEAASGRVVPLSQAALQLLQRGVLSSLLRCLPTTSSRASAITCKALQPSMAAKPRSTQLTQTSRSGVSHQPGVSWTRIPVHEFPGWCLISAKTASVACRSRDMIGKSPLSICVSRVWSPFHPVGAFPRIARSSSRARVHRLVCGRYLAVQYDTRPNPRTERAP
jgi:hypothetical protein